MTDQNAVTIRVLTEDVTNPSPDRRSSSWLCKTVWEKGTRFAAQQTLTDWGTMGEIKKGMVRISEASNVAGSRYEVLMQGSVEVGMSVDEWLTYGSPGGWEVYATDLLGVLLRRGVVTRELLEDCVAEYSKEYDEAGNPCASPMAGEAIVREANQVMNTALAAAHEKLCAANHDVKYAESRLASLTGMNSGYPGDEGRQVHLRAELTDAQDRAAAAREDIQDLNAQQA